MATTYSMFGAPRPGSVNIAGRRDVVGACCMAQSACAVAPQAAPGAERHTPTLRRLKSMRLERAGAAGHGDEQARPSSLPVMAGMRAGLDGREAHRKRVVISPSQWFSKVVNTPKATRCTIRDSPSHAMAIAALRDNNRVRVLREMHRKIIQSSAQLGPDEHHHQDAVPPAAATDHAYASPHSARDALYVESDTSSRRGCRMLLTPRRSTAKAPGAAAMRSPSPPTPTPFLLRVDEMEQREQLGEPSAEQAR